MERDDEERQPFRSSSNQHMTLGLLACVPCCGAAVSESHHLHPSNTLNIKWDSMSIPHMSRIIPPFCEDSSTERRRFATCLFMLTKLSPDVLHQGSDTIRRKHTQLFLVSGNEDEKHEI